MSPAALTPREMFERAPFIQWLGLRLHVLEGGRCESSLRVREEFGQQHGYVHAAVITALADHSAGGAAGTLLSDRESALTLEFKVNFLRPARSEELFCFAEVLKRGRTICVVESSVFSSPGKEPAHLVAKATVSMSILDATEMKQP